MHQFSDFVKISCTSNYISFKCQGDHGNTYVTKIFKGQSCILESNKKNTSGTMNGIFNLKNLVSFGKCSNLCSDVKLFFKNDYPLFVHYAVGNLGKMLIGLSPSDSSSYKDDDKELYDELNYKEFNDKEVHDKELHDKELHNKLLFDMFKLIVECNKK